VTPAALTSEAFKSYPPEARRLATERIALLRRMPLAFTPLLLREIIVYDWKFPAERRDIDRQFDYLARLDGASFDSLMAPFVRLRLTASLEAIDWVDSPGIFSEQLTSHLWATRQIDAFSAAAVDYVAKTAASAPDAPLPIHRLGVIAIGQGLDHSEIVLFRKLRPHGTYFSKVRAENGFKTVLEALDRRAQDHPLPYAHWYIDGGLPTPVKSGGIAKVSYDELTPARTALQAKMQKTYEAWNGPEIFRTQLALMKPEDIGLSSGGLSPERDPVLTRFQLSLLTEGSGTQVFSTTFAQWAAREALRRAEPLTLVVRYAPRQRDRGMNELLAEAHAKPRLDPRGSLVDADMGAYYTWLNHQRLSGAAQSRFLVWFEDHTEAIAIGPGLTPGGQSTDPSTLGEILNRLA
jgi:hypothetical protein